MFVFRKMNMGFLVLPLYIHLHQFFTKRPMKTKIYITILFIVLLCFGSCRHRYPVGLVEADSLVYSNPKLALEKLDSMETCKDTTDVSLKMYIRLLKFLAQDKLFQQNCNLSEVCQIVTFYENHNDALLLAKSYYLRGRVARNLSDNVGALANFHKVVECLDKKDDLKLRSLVNAQIAYVYSAQNNLKFALKFYKESYRCDSILKDTLGMLYGMRDLAVTFDYDNQKAKALNMFNSARKIMQNVNNEQLREDVLLQLADFYLGENNTDSAKMFVLPFLKNPQKVSANAAYVAYNYYYLENKDDSAIYYLNHVLSASNDLNTKYDASVKLTSIFFDNEDYSKAHDAYSLSLLYSDSLKYENQHEKEMKARALYEYVYQREQILNLEKSNWRKICYLLILLIFLFLLLAISYYYWQLKIVKKINIHNKINDWRKNPFRKLSVSNANKNRILNDSDLQYYLQSSKHLPENSWDELEKGMDEIYPKFKKNIYSCFALTEHEYHICMLAKLGVGTSKIARLTDRAPSTISTTKQRIYQKLTQEVGNADQFDKLIMTF